MRRKVTFQTQSSGMDPSGQVSNIWTDIYSVGANIRQTSFSETLTQRREVAVQGVQITVPFSEHGMSLTTDDSALVGAVRYEIQSIDVDTQWRRHIIVNCTTYNGK